MKNIANTISLDLDTTLSDLFGPASRDCYGSLVWDLPKEVEVTTRAGATSCGRGREIRKVKWQNEDVPKYYIVDATQDLAITDGTGREVLEVLGFPRYF